MSNSSVIYAITFVIENSFDIAGKREETNSKKDSGVQRNTAGIARGQKKKETIQLNPRTHLRENVAWKPFNDGSMAEVGSTFFRYNADEMVALVWYTYHFVGR